MWLLCGYYVVIMWLLCSYYVVIMWLLCGYYVVIMLVVYYEWRSHFGKVFSLFWLELPLTDQSVSTELLLSCGTAGEMVLL